MLATASRPTTWDSGRIFDIDVDSGANDAATSWSSTWSPANAGPRSAEFMARFGIGPGMTPAGASSPSCGASCSCQVERRVGRNRMGSWSSRPSGCRRRTATIKRPVPVASRHHRRPVTTLTVSVRTGAPMPRVRRSDVPEMDIVDRPDPARVPTVKA